MGNGNGDAELVSRLGSIVVSKGVVKAVVDVKAARSVPRSTVVSVGERNIQAEIEAPGLGQRMVSVRAGLERRCSHQPLGGGIRAGHKRPRGSDLIVDIRVQIRAGLPQSRHVVQRVRPSIRGPSSTLPGSGLQRTPGWERTEA